jgi:hypothetical protein
MKNAVTLVRRVRQKNWLFSVAVDLELTVDKSIFSWVVGQVLVVKSSLIGWGNYVHITRPTNNAG